MPNTLNSSSAPRQPATDTEAAIGSTTKAPDAPSSRHVRIRRGVAPGSIERPISAPWSGKP